MKIATMFTEPIANCHFALMGGNTQYVSEIKYDRVIMCDKIEQAIWFYSERAAYELAQELHSQTDKWFGVVNI